KRVSSRDIPLDAITRAVRYLEPVFGFIFQIAPVLRTVSWIETSIVSRMRSGEIPNAYFIGKIPQLDFKTAAQTRVSIEKDHLVMKNIYGRTITTHDGKPLKVPVRKLSEDEMKGSRQTIADIQNILPTLENRPKDRALAEEFLKYLESLITAGKVYVITRNIADIYGFANNEIICLHEDLVRNPVAWFNIAGKGYLSLQKDSIPYKGVSVYTYLRGIGSDVRAGRRDPNESERALAESPLQGKGIQDLLFSEEANNELTSRIKLVRDVLNGILDSPLYNDIMKEVLAEFSLKVKVSNGDRKVFDLSWMGLHGNDVKMKFTGEMRDGQRIRYDRRKKIIFVHEGVSLRDIPAFMDILNEALEGSPEQMSVNRIVGEKLRQMSFFLARYPDYYKHRYFDKDYLLNELNQKIYFPFVNLSAKLKDNAIDRSAYEKELDDLAESVRTFYGIELASAAALISSVEKRGKFQNAQDISKSLLPEDRDRILNRYKDRPAMSLWDYLKYYPEVQDRIQQYIMALYYLGESLASSSGEFPAGILDFDTIHQIAEQEINRTMVRDTLKELDMEPSGIKDRIVKLSQHRNSSSILERYFHSILLGSLRTSVRNAYQSFVEEKISSEGYRDLLNQLEVPPALRAAGQKVTMLEWLTDPSRDISSLAAFYKGKY
ncbi:MAG TPA: hypothetical protein VJC03_07685, partial [bacterium]|nr:hypothetical protein [bacterium]